jgi:hypothetical protein
MDTNTSSQQSLDRVVEASHVPIQPDSLFGEVLGPDENTRAYVLTVPFAEAARMVERYASGPDDPMTARVTEHPREAVYEGPFGSGNTEHEAMYDLVRRIDESGRVPVGWEQPLTMPSAHTTPPEPPSRPIYVKRVALGSVNLGWIASLAPLTTGEYP